MPGQLQSEHGRSTGDRLSPQVASRHSPPRHDPVITSARHASARARLRPATPALSRHRGKRPLADRVAKSTGMTAAYDAIVVGLRCAGAPLAMLLARKGYRVLGIDRATFPSDTISTHFLWPRTTALLNQWGLLDRLARSGCPPIDAVTLDVGPVSIRGRPDAVDGTAVMYCPRRLVLDAMLVEAAGEAGAELRVGTTVTDLVWQGDRVIGVETTEPNGQRRVAHAGLVVGADGLWSRVARAVAAPAEIQHASRSCGYYAYWHGVPTDGVAFYRRHGRVILVFPTHDQQTCVYVGWPYEETGAYRADVKGGYLATLGLAPDLARRVAAGHQAQAFKGTNKLPNYYRRAAGKGWALVGDAAYHRDPITGMGIGDAFLGARLLADAFDAAMRSAAPIDAAMAGYQEELSRLTRPVFEYTLLSAGLDDPTPLSAFYAAVARSPQATREMMNVPAGTLPFRAFFNRANIARLTNATDASSVGAVRADGRRA
jgi:2-polyprenyl-6-methoxyphenol hydroxylase-like FAD-dependent oxidoreductase